MSRENVEMLGKLMCQKVEENCYRSAKLRLIQKEPIFISSDVRAVQKKEAEKQVAKIIEQIQKRLENQGQGALLKKQCKFFSRKNESKLKEIYDWELAKIEREQQEKLDKERSLRTFKDEIVSLAVYQAINCEHANNPEKTEQAARIRETLIDCYRKQNVSRVRKVAYTVDTYLSQVKQEQINNAPNYKSKFSIQKQKPQEQNADIKTVSNSKQKKRWSRSHQRAQSQQALMKARDLLMRRSSSRMLAQTTRNTPGLSQQDFKLDQFYSSQSPIQPIVNYQMANQVFNFFSPVSTQSQIIPDELSKHTRNFQRAMTQQEFELKTDFERIQQHQKSVCSMYKSCQALLSDLEQDRLQVSQLDLSRFKDTKRQNNIQKKLMNAIQDLQTQAGQRSSYGCLWKSSDTYINNQKSPH